MNKSLFGLIIFALTFKAALAFSQPGDTCSASFEAQKYGGIAVEDETGVCHTMVPPGFYTLPSSDPENHTSQYIYGWDDSTDTPLFHPRLETIAEYQERTNRSLEKPNADILSMIDSYQYGPIPQELKAALDRFTDVFLSPKDVETMENQVRSSRKIVAKSEFDWDQYVKLSVEIAFHPDCPNMPQKIYKDLQVTKAYLASKSLNVIPRKFYFLDIETTCSSLITIEVPHPFPQQDLTEDAFIQQIKKYIELTKK